jgi:two-component system cell cycle response regulator
MTPEQKIAKLEAEVAKLRKLVSTDELTGLPNRRGLWLRLEPMVAEVNRQLTAPGQRRKIEIKSLAVVMVDIDKFKLINDTYGHGGGDSVLKQMAKVIAGRVRSIDVIGRLGGEEFLVGFLGTEQPIARRLAEDLRQIIEQTKFKLPDGAVIAVTASLGVASLEAGESLDALIGRADAALYDAKEGGRNRVVSAKVEPNP